RWADAGQMLENAVEDFSQSRPAIVSAPLVTLAELRRRQGRPQEADLLLNRAGPTPSGQLCRARLALDAGEPRRAIEVADRVLRQTPPERKLDRAPALALLVRAHVARGGRREAGAALESLREVAGLVGTEALRASVELSEGLLVAAGGDH